MSSQDPLVVEAEQRQAARDKLLSSLTEKGNSLLAKETKTSGDPLVDDEEAQQAARDSLVDSLVAKDTDMTLLAVDVKSSGDPLVDDEEELAAARDSLVNSLVAKDTDTSLLAVQDGDPLVEAQERARKAREDLVKGLAKKDTSLEAQEALDPEAIEAGLRAMNDFANIQLTATEDAVQERRRKPRFRLEAKRGSALETAAGDGVPIEAAGLEADEKETGQVPSDKRTDTLQAAEIERRRILEAREQERQRELEAAKEEGIRLKAAALAAEEEQRRKWNLEAAGGDGVRLKTTVLVADPDHAGRYLVVDSTNRDASVLRHGRHLGAGESKSHAADTGTTELAQMFGGAFLLVAAVALFAVVGRRRKATKTHEQETEDVYQLFM